MRYCKNCSIIDGSLIGDGETHSYIPYVVGGVTYTDYEWCYGVVALGSDVSLVNLHISHCCGTGITCGAFRYPGDSTKNSSGSAEISNCEISYCGGDGVGVRSNTGLTLSNVNIHHIGTYLTNPGFSPMSGIDIEFHDQLGYKGIESLNNVNIKDCTNVGILTGLAGSDQSEVKSLEIVNSQIEKVSLSNLLGPITIRDSVIDIFGSSVFMSDTIEVEDTTIRVNAGTYYFSGSFNKCHFRNYGNSDYQTDILLRFQTSRKFTAKKCKFSGFYTETQTSYMGLIYYTDVKNLNFEDCDFVWCNFTFSKLLSDISFIRCSFDKCSCFYVNSQQFRLLYNNCFFYNCKEQHSIAGTRRELLYCNIRTDFDASNFADVKGNLVSFLKAVNAIHCTYNVAGKVSTASNFGSLDSSFYQSFIRYNDLDNRALSNFASCACISNNQTFSSNKNGASPLYWDGNLVDLKCGATADRPSASTVGAGFTFFDTDLGKMIVSNGTSWVNMDGTALS